MVLEKRRATIQEWNAFIVNDFDAKGNYNFDPLCRQKMSGWTKKGGSREDAKLDGRRRRRRLATTFVARLRQMAEMNNGSGKNIEVPDNFWRMLSLPSPKTVPYLIVQCTIKYGTG